MYSEQLLRALHYECSQQQVLLLIRQAKSEKNKKNGALATPLPKSIIANNMLDNRKLRRPHTKITPCQLAHKHGKLHLIIVLRGALQLGTRG